MHCSQSEAGHYARLLLSGYPHANPPDPTYYLAQVVAAMTGYDLKIVKAACEPSGIPAQCPKFLPAIGEIKAWLQARAEEQSKYEFHQSQPRRLPVPRSDKKSPMWNLFIGKDVPGYDRVVEMAKERPQDHHKYEEKHLRPDGSISDGIWVPWPWWEEIKGKKSSSFSGLE